MSKALPTKAEAAEDHAAGDARTHVAKRGARTALQGGVTAGIGLLLQRITGWELSETELLVVVPALMWAVNTAQTLIENLTARTLPGVLSDGIHRTPGDKANGLPEPTETPWANGD